jgi:hypothetical protein
VLDPDTPGVVLPDGDVDPGRVVGVPSPEPLGVVDGFVAPDVLGVPMPGPVPAP